MPFVYTEADIKKLETDAQAFRHLRDALGYIEAGEGQVVTIYQDDATGSWGITCGRNTKFTNARYFQNTSLHGALAEAGNFYKHD